MGRKPKDDTYNDLAKLFGERLESIRIKNRFSKAELARCVGCTGQSISLMAKGEFLPTVPALVRIANTLNCSADFLLGVTSNPEVNSGKDGKTMSLKDFFDNVTISYGRVFVE